jgi:asparagine synthetase B (glutamine-hydrolysing)
MPEKIDPTWLAYALDRPQQREPLHAGVRRLLTHYSGLIDYPLAVSQELGPTLGLVSLSDAVPVVRWPAFSRAESRITASAYPVTGWRRILGETYPATEAADALGAALLRDPDQAANSLPAPAVIGVLDLDRERLLIVNDFIGVGRIYEYRFSGGTIWSNRAAAPLLFSGRRPEASEHGWRVLAAAMWPIGTTTPLRGVSKVPGGTVIDVTAERLTRRRTHAIAPLVETRRPRRLAERADAASARAVTQVLEAAELWPGPMDVDLSGGRDSRVVSAAVVHAGVEARFLTSDVTPGEAEVARQVVKACGAPISHLVRKDADYVPADHKRPISARALNVHLLHDGMRHPQKLRGKSALPRTRPAGAVLSGHGGDVAHGYFYKTWRQYVGLRAGGKEATRDRVTTLFAKDHGLASSEAYRAALTEADRLLDEACDYGVKAPTELEYFYIVDRFAHRQGLGAHVERVSIFGTQEFVQAAFALRPRQRLSSTLHRLMINRLAPEWNRVPFFKAERSRLPSIRRLRLWESEADAADFEQILAGEGSWTELFDPVRTAVMWRAARDGQGQGKWEGVFETIVYRTAFDRYLELLAAQAAVGPRLA